MVGRVTLWVVFPRVLDQLISLMTIKLPLCQRLLHVDVLKIVIFTMISVEFVGLVLERASELLIDLLRWRKPDVLFAAFGSLVVAFYGR